MADTWTKEDTAAALAQGWNLWEVWVGENQRLEYVVQRVGKREIMKSDEAARKFVHMRATDGDELAAKATRMVFVSKVKGVPKTKKKKEPA